MAHHHMIDRGGVGPSSLQCGADGNRAELFRGDGSEASTGLTVTALATQPLAERCPSASYDDDAVFAHAKPIGRRLMSVTVPEGQSSLAVFPFFLRHRAEVVREVDSSHLGHVVYRRQTLDEATHEVARRRRAVVVVAAVPDSDLVNLHVAYGFDLGRHHALDLLDHQQSCSGLGVARSAVNEILISLRFGVENLLDTLSLCLVNC